MASCDHVLQGLDILYQHEIVTNGGRCTVFEIATVCFHAFSREVIDTVLSVIVFLFQWTALSLHNGS